MQPSPLYQSARVAFANATKANSEHRGPNRNFRVDITVPPGGLGTRLDAMYEFHARHEPQRGHGAHSADGAVIRWCFEDAETAKAFAADFG